MPCARLLAAALHRGLELAAQVRDEGLHRLGVAGEFCRARVNSGCERGHRRTLSASSRTAAGRSAYAGFRSCPPRSRRAWRRADIADRKSTRLNSSHLVISYAVFCLKKKKKLS